MRLIRNAKFWIGILFLIVIISLRYSPVGNYMTLESIQEKRLALEQAVMQHYLWSVLIFILWYIVVVIMALPIVALSTILGGFLFGIVPAVIYCNIGATVGATIFFFIVRSSLGDALQERYKKQLVWFNAQIEKHGVSYLIFMRFVSFIPFFVENLLAGLSKVSIWTFAWTTSLGTIPGSVVFAFAGRQLMIISAISDLFSWNMLLVFTLLALLAVAPVFVYRLCMGNSR